jgi:PKD repeat protein
MFKNHFFSLLSSLFLIVFLTNCKKTDSNNSNETIPTACLSVSKNNVVVGETFTAYNCSSNGSTFQWEDGDGTVTQASSTTPRNILYNAPGVYTLKLTAYSPNKTQQNSITTTINVTQSVGNAMVWTSNSSAAGPISVYVNNILIGTITSWFSSMPSNCGTTGCVTFQNVPGVYSIYATDGSNVWNGNVTIIAGGCFKLQLQ